MKVSAHVLAYNVDRFIGLVIKNTAPHVDKIYIAYPTRPLGYNECSRLQMSNPTSLSYVEEIAKASECTVEVIVGDWAIEEDMRNVCLEKARSEGFDWFIIQDPDEFYTDHTWEQIKKDLV